MLVFQQWTHPLFCFGSCWMTQVFLWNASSPASHSVHHSKYTAEALFKPRALQGDGTFSSPAQPLLTINHTPPAAHPCGLAFCNHPSPSHSSWGSVSWSIRRLSLFLKPFRSFDHIKFVCTSGLLLWLFSLPASFFRRFLHSNSNTCHFSGTAFLTHPFKNLLTQTFSIH